MDKPPARSRPAVPAAAMHGGAQGEQLMLANEQLVLAALHSQAAADAARSELHSLQFASQRDVLTGLPNRALMRDRMETAMALARRRDTKLAVLFVDIDHFKGINDRLGHSTGDAVLCHVASCLTDSVRESDTVSRHGGDEFLVLLNEVTSAADAIQVAAKIRASLAEPSRLDDRLPALHASVGIAVFPEHGAEAAELLAYADAEMYLSKHRVASKLSTAAPAAGERARAAVSAATVLPVLPDPPVRQPAAAGPRGSDLLHANERLVLAAVASMQAEQQVAQAHARHVAFVATVMHELRNPLAPIRTAAMVLSRSYPNDPALQRLAAVVERQAQHMSRLVEDLMDGARSRVGRFTLDCTRLDLRDVLTPLLEASSASMQALQQVLTWQLPEVPLPVDGDEVRLRQIFANLLENASKYTPAGGAVKLSASLLDKAVRITIEDNGIGIDASALALIFDLFVQGTEPSPMHRHGLGIGLAVVRELVESHGGSVHAHSAGVGQGSCFVVSLLLPVDQRARVPTAPGATL